MPRQARKKSETGIYHIILRGTNKQEIFHDEGDCQRFLETLEKYKKPTEMSVYGWCLMGNHIHILIREGKEEVALTMKRIGVSFVSYYNLKYQTTGYLFQDRFRSEVIDTDEYLLTAIRYIHQNPVKAGIVQKPADWKWSSCCGYYRQSAYLKKLLDSNVILNMFSAEINKSIEMFKTFNEENNNDICLDINDKRRITDEEARQKINKLIDGIEIVNLKRLPKSQRNEILRLVKSVDGITLRQAARILGIPSTLVFKA